MNALADLVKDSTVMFFKCNVNSNCNVTISKDEINVYDFYNYYYDYTMNETINFNLMMITAFIGGLLLRWKGFKITTGLLCIPSFGATVWLWNFNYNFKVDVVFDYDILKIINLIFIYILYLCGIGGSALLSQQILIEGHLKYKFNLFEKKIEQLTPTPTLLQEGELNIIGPIYPIDKRTRSIHKSVYTSSNKTNLLTNKISPSKSFLFRKNSKDIYKNIKEEQKKKIEEKEKRRTNNKFDYFFMICLTTIIGYLGKYLMNLFLDSILKHIFGNNYDKRYFLISIMILYGVSIVLSIVVYLIYKNCVFESVEKEEKDKIIKISQICGYTIYSETKKPKVKARRNCCTLCCESIQNCCDQTFCNIINNICEICVDEPQYSCCCYFCCKYREEDYNKKEEVFCYCYKTKRKSLWCNKFFANETQKKIFPYMLEYFILQLTTIGFEKQYENYKNKNVHIKTWVSVFVLSFILFFYFTLSFKRIFYDDKINKNEEQEENDIENLITTDNNKDKLTILSNNILNGTHGILIFNAIFSAIFSYIYLSYNDEDIKKYFFEENINIILMPILMNKFYYFTLNYYCIYTGEKEKKFEILSVSTLVSVYINIWKFILTLIKAYIPDENSSDDFDYNNILYIIQLVVSVVPFLAVIIFIFVGICISTGFYAYIRYGCKCKDCKNPFYFFQFLCWLISCLFCFGGLWIKMEGFGNYKFDCCSLDECCVIRTHCYIFFIDNINEKGEKYLVCDCCCCDKGSSCCYSECCYKHCNTCQIFK